MGYVILPPNHRQSLASEHYKDYQLYTIWASQASDLLKKLISNALLKKDKTVIESMTKSLIHC